MLNSKERGFGGEENTSVFLKNKGFKIITRNYRTNFGEIDIIAKKDNEIYFFEVKVIKNQEYLPEAKINSRKKLALKRTATSFLQSNHYGLDEIDFRFVLVAILESEGKYKFSMIEINI